MIKKYMHWLFQALHEMHVICLLPFTSNPVPQVPNQDRWAWGTAAPNEGTEISFAAANQQWSLVSERPALISAAEVCCVSPLPPQHLDIPHCQLHASEASTWGNKAFLWCLRRALCSRSMQLAQWFVTGPRCSRWAVPHRACLCGLWWQAGMDTGLINIAQPMVMWFLKKVQIKQRVDVPRSVPMAQPFISHGTKPPSTQVLCMERSGLTHDLPQVQHDHRKPAELQHPLCLQLAQLLPALPSSSEISVEVILWHAFMLADGNVALEMKEVTRGSSRMSFFGAWSSSPFAHQS